ncbi:MAG: ABC transporter permease [Actinomycetota bacterium]
MTAPALSRARAFVVRDYRVERTYRAAVAGQLCGGLLFLASYALVAPVVGEGFEERFGTSYAAFVAVGIAVSGVLVTALQAFSGSVREAQLDGTLEALLLAPVRHEEVVALMGAWPLGMGLVSAALTLGAAALAGVGFDVAPASVALALACSVAAFVALGLLSAAAVLVVKRGNPVATLIGMTGALVGGAYVPTSTFPGWLEAVAAVNPMTYALDAWRGALLAGDGPGAIAGDLAVLAATAAVALPLAWWAVGRAVDVARADGTVATY